MIRLGIFEGGRLEPATENHYSPMRILSMAKRHEVNVAITTRQRVSLAGEARKAGKGRKRGWFHTFLVGTVPQRGHPGKFAIIAQFKKRFGFGNWYSETVKDEETDELLHHCEEPFNEHTGHGSAKNRKLPNKNSETLPK
jgi:hypothetical protein